MGYWTMACLRRAINTNRNIPHLFKLQLINEVQRNLMIRSWERVVADELNQNNFSKKNHQALERISLGCYDWL